MLFNHNLLAVCNRIDNSERFVNAGISEQACTTDSMQHGMHVYWPCCHESDGFMDI